MPANIKRTPKAIIPDPRPAKREASIKARPLTMHIAGTVLANTLKLNFIEGIISWLVPNGKAAIVLCRDWRLGGFEQIDVFPDTG
jgi:hypothetical protein